VDLPHHFTDRQSLIRRSLSRYQPVLPSRRPSHQNSGRSHLGHRRGRCDDRSRRPFCARSSMGIPRILHRVPSRSADSEVHLSYSFKLMKNWRHSMTISDRMARCGRLEALIRKKTALILKSFVSLSFGRLDEGGGSGGPEPCCTGESSAPQSSEKTGALGKS
jgi:hypothetical protein